MSPEKRYQVFVSSTYSDLAEERREIIESLLDANFIPAGMEFFTASPEEQFNYIKKIINLCDYYVLIIAGRYGTVNPDTGISYTEQEYEYALSKGIPVLVFVHDDPYNLTVDLRDDNNRENFVKFRNRAMENRLCKMWHDKSKLISSVVVSIIYASNEIDRPGWTRNAIDENDLLRQINQLRLQNDTLLKENQELKLQIEDSCPFDGIASLDEEYTVNYLYVPANEKRIINVQWKKIFLCISTAMAIESCTISEVKKRICEMIQKNREIDLCVDDIKVLRNDAFIIVIQFIAHGLLARSGEAGELYHLTKKGLDYMYRGVAIKSRQN